MDSTDGRASGDGVVLDREDAVVVARIDNGTGNPLDDRVVERLDAALDDLAPDAALVLTGRPGIFTGGLDVSVLAAGGERAEALLSAMGALLVRVLESPRPVVVAADGHAVAAGAMLMLAADMALVSDRPARFGFAEVPNGLALPAGAVELVASRADPTATLRLVAHGDLVGPEEAVRLGLARQLVPEADLLVTAVAHAGRLAALPADAYAVTKRRAVRGLADRLRHPDRTPIDGAS